MNRLAFAWTVPAEARANALVRGGVAFEPPRNLRVSADYTRFDRDGGESFSAWSDEMR